ncbi:MAG: hypothetical protein QME96_07950 [Myxococcota bacterium]|nr:hypothetical protein [Myxococcota bacterium]
MMRTPTTTRCAAVAALIACAAAAGCAKGRPGADAVAVPEDRAAPPPRPPPALVERSVEIDGWKMTLSVPDDFEAETHGTFRPKGEGARGNMLTVGTACDGRCGAGGWIARADRIVLAAASGMDRETSDGRTIKAQVRYNRKVADGRYEYEVSVPKGEGILDEPFIAGGVLVFDDAWPAYVACEYVAAFETAPTYAGVLAEACASLKVLAAPPAPPASPPPPPVEEE